MSVQKAADHDPSLPAEYGDTLGLQEGLARIRREVESGSLPEALALAEFLAVDWPDDPTIQHWRRVLQPTTIRLLPSTGPRDFQKEREWMSEHAHEYPGQWVALKGNELLCADRNAGAVHRAMVDRPDASELLVCYVPPDLC